MDSYAPLCDHQYLFRVDDNFVRCRQCGLSFVSQKKIPRNKGAHEFIRENTTFGKNFDRHFNNIVEKPIKN
jgi:uncharacterized C2H2 Zn-finger protein